jgi:hypothetical protein
MLYPFSSTTRWWRYIASRLTFADYTVIVSDLPTSDIDITKRYYELLKSVETDRVALDQLGADACDDVILRCRFLRELDRHLALRLIGAMWQTIEELLDRERPDVFLGFVVDRFILDLFDRALTRRGIPYLGITVAIPPDQVMFMAKGERIALREPGSEEIESTVAAVANDDFVPSYVGSANFGRVRFAKLYAWRMARFLAFEVLLRARRKPYDMRYLSARWPVCGYRVRLRDWKVKSFLSPSWKGDLDAVPFEKRVFVALSVNPEAAIEYWVDDPGLIDYADTLERLAGRLGAAGYTLFVKDHPSQFGFRQVELFQRLAKFPNVAFVPYEVSAQQLINECKTTFAWTGTVGFQAALAGRCAVVASSAYYYVEGLFVPISSIDDIDDLAQRIERFEPSLPLAEARRALVRHVLRSSAPGVYSTWRGFSPRDPDDVRRIESLIDSFNRYIPNVVAQRAEQLLPTAED